MTDPRDVRSASDSRVKSRPNPIRHKHTVTVGCGAGFAGDRIAAALKLLNRVPNLDYLVLECLAERTLANRFDAAADRGLGYDPRIASWMEVLLPVAVNQAVCIITNMGATDPLGAQNQVLETASELNLQVNVAVVFEEQNSDIVVGSSTYLGAPPIVHALEYGNPNVIITTRTADAALFLAPMVYELGWDWDQFDLLAQGTLAGHLLECGCQLTGGYYTHPADHHRKFPIQQLLDISLPYAEVSWDGTTILCKAAGSGGELSAATCAQQLLYEIGDPASYITPDVVVDFTNVSFEPQSKDRVLAKGARPSLPLCPESLLRLIPEHCGVKGWGEISYGGPCCEDRAAAADFLVRAWMEEAFPGSGKHILSYMIGVDSLRVWPRVQAGLKGNERMDGLASEVRLRMDGLFQSRAHAQRLTQEFEALYTNGPAGGGGISTGYKDQILLTKVLVPREEVTWRSSTRSSECAKTNQHQFTQGNETGIQKSEPASVTYVHAPACQPAPGGVSIPLYEVAHSRTGDKGNQLNVSLIPHCSTDISRLKTVITPQWVKQVAKPLLESEKGNVPPPDLDPHSTWGSAKRQPTEDSHLQIKIYQVQGVCALNVVLTGVLDGGVTCSRRLDRHGKSLSDLFLCQYVTLPAC